jgi:hypothetical protein
LFLRNCSMELETFTDCIRSQQWNISQVQGFPSNATLFK